MVATVEELAKEQAILDAKLQRVEREQQVLSRSQADIRERQTRAEETDKRILDQLTFIHADMNRRFESVERQFDMWRGNLTMWRGDLPNSKRILTRSKITGVG